MSSLKPQYRSIFISDIHLGTKGCQAKALKRYLKEHTAENLYLVGDIIDGWRLSRRIYWPKSHNEILRLLLRLSHRGIKIHYVLGNHDEALRKWLGYNLQFGSITISNRQEYTSLNGNKYLIVHGDMFDGLMKKDLKWIMHLGDILYQLLIWLNTRLNKVRGLLGMDYWSLSKHLKQKTKKALDFIDGFENKLALYAHKKHYDGIICGHIHSAAIKEINSIQYINTGDWVESCSAITEDWDGNFSLSFHTPQSAQVKTEYEKAA